MRMTCHTYMVPGGWQQPAAQPSTHQSAANCSNQQVVQDNQHRKPTGHACICGGNHVPCRQYVGAGLLVLLPPLHPCLI